MKKTKSMMSRSICSLNSRSHPWDRARNLDPRVQAERKRRSSKCSLSNRSRCSRCSKRQELILRTLTPTSFSSCSMRRHRRLMLKDLKRDRLQAKESQLLCPGLNFSLTPWPSHRRSSNLLLQVTACHSSQIGAKSYLRRKPKNLLLKRPVLTPKKCSPRTCSMDRSSQSKTLMRCQSLVKSSSTSLVKISCNSSSSTSSNL